MGDTIQGLMVSPMTPSIRTTVHKYCENSPNAHNSGKAFMAALYFTNAYNI